MDTIKSLHPQGRVEEHADALRCLWSPTDKAANESIDDYLDWLDAHPADKCEDFIEVTAEQLMGKCRKML